MRRSQKYCTPDEHCGQADIAVDQLMLGPYSTVSIEMMARGLPVMCRIRYDLRAYYPDDLPVVSAGPHDVFEVLEGLLHHQESWTELGIRGVEYVKREHEMHKVAARALALYNIGFADDVSSPPIAASVV